MKKITLSEIHKPPVDFKGGNLVTSSKEKMLLGWIIEWVEEGLKEGRFEAGDYLPSKKDFAKYHNVSTGTMQNVIRYAEDLGYFKSRQCKGTMIADKNAPHLNEKGVSKKDAACIKIKNYIIEKKLKEGARLPSLRVIANEIETSQNTVRLAFDVLTREGIIKSIEFNANKPSKILNVDYKEIDPKKETGGGLYKPNSKEDIEAHTLSEILYLQIKDYILKNYNLNDKIMPNEKFAKMFNVSVRTINDAMKRLNKEKIVLSLRGRYGTRFINRPGQNTKNEGGEKSKFMSAPKRTAEIKNSYMYSWQRVLDQIKKYMITNHEAGDKLPSMKALAQILNVSSNTVRRAVKELSNEGILICERGKHGGIYILEMPAKEDAYTWLALNPKFLVQ